MAAMLRAESLNENHNVKLYDAKFFLHTVVPKLDLSNQNQELMMDIGCGSGQTCVKMILPSFPGVKKIIGIDNSEAVIDFAKENNAHEKIEYHVADIENSGSLSQWSHQISKVVSIYHFHWLENQQVAFENIHHLLKPGGEAALVFILTTALWDSFLRHYNRGKFRRYLENKRNYIPESHFLMHDAAFYRNLLKNIGFDVIVCDETERTFTFPDDETCKATLVSLCGMARHIPEFHLEAFEEDTFENFLVGHGCCHEGEHQLNYKILTLLIKKPLD